MRFGLLGSIHRSLEDQPDSAPQVRYGPAIEGFEISTFDENPTRTRFLLAIDELQ
jgi:hypothetical protein